MDLWSGSLSVQAAHVCLAAFPPPSCHRARVRTVPNSEGHGHRGAYYKRVNWLTYMEVASHGYLHAFWTHFWVLGYFLKEQSPHWHNLFQKSELTLKIQYGVVIRNRNPSEAP